MSSLFLSSFSLIISLSFSLLCALPCSPSFLSSQFPLFPLSLALPSLSRDGNFSLARGVSLLPFFHFLSLSLTFSLFSSASLLAFPSDGTYFRRERTAGRTLISLRPLPLLAPLFRAREGEIMATENNFVASLLLATERGTSPSLSSFLLSPALSLFISSSPRSLSPSLLASSYFSRDGNFPRGSFLRRPSLVLFLSSSARRLSLLPPLFFVYRMEDSSSSSCSSRSRGKKGDERERDRKFLSIRRFCMSDPRFDRSEFDRSGLTGMLKERVHQINGQKCSRLKSRYLPILMELRAEISCA